MMTRPLVLSRTKWCRSLAMGELAAGSRPFRISNDQRRSDYLPLSNRWKYLRDSRPAALRRGREYREDQQTPGPAVSHAVGNPLGCNQ